VAVVLTFDPHPRRSSTRTAPRTPSTPGPEGGASRRPRRRPPGRARLRRGGRGADAGVFAREVLRERSTRATWWWGVLPLRPRRQGDAEGWPRSGGAGLLCAGRPPVLEQGRPVSSSRVRDALVRGEVRAARALLGRPYFVDAPVVRGTGAGARSECRPRTSLRERGPAAGASMRRGAVFPGALAARGGQRRPQAHLRRQHVTVEATSSTSRGPLRCPGAARVPRAPARRGALRRPEALVARIREDIARARGVLSGPAAAGYSLLAQAHR